MVVSANSLFLRNSSKVTEGVFGASEGMHLKFYSIGIHYMLPGRGMGYEHRFTSKTIMF